MSVFFDDDVAFIPVGKLSEYPNVKRKVEALARTSCGEPLVLATEVPAFLAMCVSFENVPPKLTMQCGAYLDERNLEIAYYERIRGFLSVRVFPSHGEIYDVCVDARSRGEGVAGILLKAVKKNVKDSLWLGIVLLSPFWTAALRSYAKVGFSKPVVSSVTPAGKKFGFPFLSLTSEVGATISPAKRIWTKVVERADKVRDVFLERNGVKRERAVIKKSSLEWIRKDLVIGGKSEYGGRFELEEGELKVRNVVEGGKGVVQVPNYWASWHTHPLSCYEESSCSHGWPSGPDMAAMVSTKARMFHVVFSAEGAYTLQLTPAAYKAFDSMSEVCSKTISGFVSDRFAATEKFRGGGPAYLRAFVALAKTFTLKDLAEWAGPFANIQSCTKDADVNEPLFIADLVDWDTALCKGLVVDILVTVDPPEEGSPEE